MQARVLEWDGKLLSLRFPVVHPAARQQISTVLCRLQKGPRGVYGFGFTHPAFKCASWLSSKPRLYSRIKSIDADQQQLAFVGLNKTVKMGLF